MYSASGIRDFCTDIQQVDPEVVDYRQFEAFARWTRTVFTDEFCLDVNLYSRATEAVNGDWDFIGFLNWQQFGVNFAYPVPSRPILYWRCTQLGQFGTTVNADTLFSHAIGQDLYFNFCRAAFGPSFRFEHLAGAVELLSVNYGGQMPKVADVIFTNGQLDPALGSGVFVDDPDVNTHVLEIESEFCNV